jgi:folate-binding protein YgfZ
MGLTIEEHDGAARTQGRSADDAQWIDLNEYAVVALTGPDAKTFLQGYLTCDMNHLSDRSALLGVFCDLKGRAIADVVVAQQDDRVLLWLHASLVDTLAAALQKYLMFARSKLTALRDWISLGRHDDANEPRTPLTVDAVGAGLRISMPAARAPRSLLLLPLTQALGAVAAGGIRDGADWRAADVDAGWVHLVRTTSGLFLPQMLGYTALGAVSFSKGCYLGQEIVARAEHRGAIKRQLTRATWQGDHPPHLGDIVLDAAGTRLATVVGVTGAAPGGGALLVATETDQSRVGRTAAGITIAIR